MAVSVSQADRERSEVNADLLMSNAKLFGESFTTQIREGLTRLQALCAAQDHEAALKCSVALMESICGAYRSKVAERAAEIGLPQSNIDKLLRQIPEGSAVAPSGVTPGLLWVLGLFPEGAGIIAEAEERRDFSKMSELIRTQMRKLTHPPEHQIDSSLTWYMASAALGNSLTDSKGFLERMQRFIELKEDPAQRIECAHHVYGKWIEKSRANNEFGPDVPFQFLSCFSQIDKALAPASFLGHNISVAYLKKEGVYVIMSHPQELDLRGFEFSKHLIDLEIEPGKVVSHPTGILQGLPKAHFALAIDRKEVIAALKHLRSSGKYEFVPAREHTNKGLEFEDPFRHSSRYHFLGQTTPEPLIPAAIYEFKARAEAYALLPDGSHSSVRSGTILADGVRVYFDGAENIIPAPLGIEMSKTLSLKDWEAVERCINGVNSARAVIWNNGRISVVLNRSIKIPAAAMTPEPVRFVKGDDIAFYGWQTFSSRKDWNLFRGAPEIFRTDSRFRQDPFRIDYYGISKLELGIPVNRNALQYAVDPNLSAIGIRPMQIKLESGPVMANCISDLREFSIPLSRPIEHLFRNDALAKIRPLQIIPEAKWPVIVRALTGRYLESIAQINIDPLAQGDEREQAGVGALDRENKLRALSQEFYAGPAKSVIIAGTWIIFHCERGRNDYYLLDSPDPEFNAIYVFKSYRAAREWAQHFQNPGAGRKRTDALRDLDCLGRIIHSVNYMDNLASLLNRRLSQ